jgi:hypothetical protein
MLHAAEYGQQDVARLWIKLGLHRDEHTGGGWDEDDQEG